MSDTAKISIGDGVTLVYPQDKYGFVVTEKSASGKTLTLLPLITPSKDTGHEVSSRIGPWPVWDHIYTEDELVSMRSPHDNTMKVRQRKDGRYYTSYGAPIDVRRAQYFRDFSD